jgi:ketosteroid isomerase-like protein
MNMQRATVDPPHAARGSFALAQALNAGDLESATACFARDGCLVTPDATAIHGRDRVRPVLAQMVVRHTEIRIELSSAIRAGGVILAHERWTVRSDGPESSRVAQTLNPTLLLRQIEAEWKLAIAAPWGCGRAIG